MKETVILTWCGPCKEKGVEATATHTDAVALNSPVAREVDTCDKHYEAVIVPLQHLLDVDGQPIPERASQTRTRRRDDTPAEDKRFTCPVCPDRGWVTRTGLIAHLYADHLGEEKPTQPPVCPDCGYPAKPGGMGHHRKSEHGYDVLEDALRRVTAKKPRRGAARKSA